MYEIFGFKILTKKEQKERDEAFARMVFPNGDAQKKEVLEHLKKEIPGWDEMELLYLYASVVQGMKEKGQDFIQALGRMKSPGFRKLKAEETEALRRIVERYY
ncbi:MAG: hypothetical protein Q4C63_06245 [Eubacteriales bacterium]|nr:hypothetical protein [Eubacteriales bacterium]